MKTFFLQFPNKMDDISREKKILAMGFFDGVHKGHREVLRRAKSLADSKKETFAVLTYDIHPSVVFGDEDKEFKYITPLEEKKIKFSEYGVEEVYVMHLDKELAKLTPQEYIDDVIIRLNATDVVAGFDHQYGRPNTNADMAHLASYSRGKFNVVTVSKFIGNIDEKISSTTIRNKLENGDVETVSKELLGYPLILRGEVVKGDQRGKELGFPTANTLFDIYQRIPGEGVYLTRTRILGEKDWHNSMTSVGKNETFEEGRPTTVETFILNFDDDIYGRIIEIDWLKKIRNQIKFENADALIQQISADKQQAEHLFKNI